MARKDGDGEEILKYLHEHNTDIKHELKEIKEGLQNLHITTTKQQGILDEHIRRTAAVEQHVRLLESDHSERIAPLERHTAMWAGAMKVLLVLGAIAGIATAVWKIIMAVL